MQVVVAIIKCVIDVKMASQQFQREILFLSFTDLHGGHKARETEKTMISQASAWD